MAKYAITTFDNPYEPYSEDWQRFEFDHGYNTLVYLDRIAMTSDSLSDEENSKEIERAIDEIIRFDFRNMYRKVEIFEGEQGITKYKPLEIDKKD